jgi:hypothetical protein
MARAILGLLLVFGAVVAHFGLIVAGVYRKYPIEWWAVTLAGVGLAVSALKTPRTRVRVVAVLALLLAVLFAIATTFGSRIPRPDLAIAPGRVIAAVTLVADDGTPFPIPRGHADRKTLLVLFRGVW